MPEGGRANKKEGPCVTVALGRLWLPGSLSPLVPSALVAPRYPVPTISARCSTSFCSMSSTRPSLMRLAVAGPP